MHPRSVFKKKPDYTALAIKHSDFRHVCQLELTGKVSIDFKNENALRTLSRTLLREYFQLDVEFAPKSLVPTIPLRLNYVLWLEDLIAPLQLENVSGIDIGCGSSCVYSLIAARKNKWHMYALETKITNVEYALANVTRNDLNSLVRVFKQPHNVMVIFKHFLETKEYSEEIYDFCLCNPPFYDRTEAPYFQGKTRNPERRPPPNNARTGEIDELSCIGGEVAFVQRIIKESVTYKDKIKIYTSMLGHKGSLQTILEFLKEHNIKSVTTTEFHQGKTTRWGVAWSFCAAIQSDAIDK